jgi:hypothetical protein
MGILDLITGGFFGRKDDDDDEKEKLVPGPMGTEELPEEKQEYGRHGGDLETLRERNVEREREETGNAAAEGIKGPESTPRDARLDFFAEKFRQRSVRPRRFFGRKTARVLGRVERGIERIQSAETSAERHAAKSSFRRKVFRRLTRSLGTALEGKLEALTSKRSSEIERLRQKGASKGEIRRTEARFEQQERELKRGVDRRLGRPLRGLWRRAGGMGGGWHPKF